MKSEELQGLGLTKEQMDKVFELNGKDVNSAKEANKEEVNDLKTQLNTLMEQVKKFDGVDPTNLTKQISDLNVALETQKAEYEKKIADRDFDDLLSKAITTAGGRNEKAVKALLNIEELKASKNQKEDIDNALGNIKKENDYLFESKEPIKNPVGRTGSNGAGASGSFSTDSEKLESARKVMGLNAKKKEG